MTKLSPHFSLAEMTVTNSGLPNHPDAKQLAALTKLCERVLEPVRLNFGKPVTVNSGFRGKQANAAVGGSQTSQHSLGEAADIEIRGVHNEMIYKFIRDNLEFDQLIAEKLSKTDGSAGWIHVSYRDGRLRKQCLSFLGGGKYVNGLVFV